MYFDSWHNHFGIFKMSSMEATSSEVSITYWLTVDGKRSGTEQIPHQEATAIITCISIAKESKIRPLSLQLIMLEPQGVDQIWQSGHFCRHGKQMPFPSTDLPYLVILPGSRVYLHVLANGINEISVHFKQI